MDQNPYEPVNTPPPIQPPPPYTQPPRAGGGLTDNVVGALAYVTFIPAIIFLLLEPYNKSAFVRFHCFQSIAYAIAVFVIHFIFAFIPFIGWLISLLLSVVFLVLWIMLVIKAYQGEWYKLPILGDFAMDQARK